MLDVTDTQRVLDMLEYAVIVERDEVRARALLVNPMFEIICECHSMSLYSVVQQRLSKSGNSLKYLSKYGAHVFDIKAFIVSMDTIFLSRGPLNQ